MLLFLILVSSWFCLLHRDRAAVAWVAVLLAVAPFVVVVAEVSSVKSSGAAIRMVFRDSSGAFAC